MHIIFGIVAATFIGVLSDRMERAHPTEKWQLLGRYTVILVTGAVGAAVAHGFAGSNPMPGHLYGFAGGAILSGLVSRFLY